MKIYDNNIICMKIGMSIYTGTKIIKGFVNHCVELLKYYNSLYIIYKLCFFQSIFHIIILILYDPLYRTSFHVASLYLLLREVKGT